MTLFQSLILAAVQALTEFLPISSDGHLNLVQHLFGITPSLTFDIFLHAATFLSVLFFFRSQVPYFLKNLKYILVGSIPVGIAGLLFKDSIKSLSADVALLPVFFFFSGAAVVSTRWLKKQERGLDFKRAFLIGIFQALAILPGVSRSGLTIFSSVALGLSFTEAFRFSFSLFIPATLGALILDAENLLALDLDLSSGLLVFSFTFILGLLAINLLEKLIQKRLFWVFGVYVLFLSLLLLIFPLV